jgi:GMP synthase (glutamine-hydrolysing)
MEHLRQIAPVALYRPLCGQTLPDPSTISGVVILGSHHNVHDALPALNREREWVARVLAGRSSSSSPLLPKMGTFLPILGICFGAQLIAQIGGAHVFRGRYPEIGAHPVHPAAGQAWLGAPMNVMQWHHDGIATVPAGGQLVATGQEAFPIQAFAWRQALALQFHPETTPSMVRRWAQQHQADEPRLQQELAQLHAMRAWFATTLDRLFSSTPVAPRREAVDEVA